MLKQVIVMRKDLNMRKGKMAAQSAHATIAVLLRQQQISEETLNNANHHVMILTMTVVNWLRSGMTKIVVGVEDEQELRGIVAKAQAAGLWCSTVIDAGKTEFPEPTLTCCAIGPDEAEKIDAITGHLALL